MEWVPDMNVPRQAHSSAVMGNNLFLFGGITQDEDIPNAPIELLKLRDPDDLVEVDANQIWDIVAVDQGLDQFFPSHFMFALVAPVDEQNIAIWGGIPSLDGNGEFNKSVVHFDTKTKTLHKQEEKIWVEKHDPFE